jgi:hypothetical protein
VCICRWFERAVTLTAQLDVRLAALHVLRAQQAVG